MTEKLLETMSELDVINQKLIPALDLVGDKYEKQKIFLPQLINAANAACAGFDLIKLRIAKRGGESVSKGKIIMATVEGDIHDIGKNIVRVVLENYGYQVIDLGRDVPVQTVVDTAIAEDVKLVGLSALMTTTVDSMRRTIEALRASGHDCKVMVGGRRADGGLCGRNWRRLLYQGCKGICRRGKGSIGITRYDKHSRLYQASYSAV